jgi:hypothetical protein
MSKLNNGKPAHGSCAVEHGKLEGATDTDYFYFFCPKCPDRFIMRLLDYEVRDQLGEHPYAEQTTKRAAKAFRIVLKLYCENCKLQDFVKIRNTGWQGGLHKDALYRIAPELENGSRHPLPTP